MSTPIQPYGVPGLGTVESHGDAGDVYHLRACATPNQINAYRAPAGQLCDPARAAADIAEAIANPPVILAAVPVPASVRNGQLRQWLNRNGLLAAVEAKFETPELWPDETTRIDAKIRWEFEPNVVRYDPLVESLGHSLGMTDAQLDAAFIEISQIP